MTPEPTTLRKIYACTSDEEKDAPLHLVVKYDGAVRAWGLQIVEDFAGKRATLELYDEVQG